MLARRRRRVPACRRRIKFCPQPPPRSTPSWPASLARRLRARIVRPSSFACSRTPSASVGPAPRRYLSGRDRPNSFLGLCDSRKTPEGKRRLPISPHPISSATPSASAKGPFTVGARVRSVARSLQPLWRCSAERSHSFFCFGVVRRSRRPDVSSP